MMLDCFGFPLDIECLEVDTVSMSQEEPKHIMKKILSPTTQSTNSFQTQSERIKETPKVLAA